MSYYFSTISPMIGFILLFYCFFTLEEYSLWMSGNVLPVSLSRIILPWVLSPWETGPEGRGAHP